MSTWILVVTLALGALSGCRDRNDASRAAPATQDVWGGAPRIPSKIDVACPSVIAPYLYRVEKGYTTSYILGTRHMSVGIGKFPPELTQALASTQMLVVEVADESPADAQKRDPEGPRLSDDLGPELWKHLQNVIGEDRAAALDDLTPTAALLTMSVRFEDMSSQLDNELEATARYRGMRVVGLETGAFQLRLLEKWFDLRLLRATVKHLESAAELETDSLDGIRRYCLGTDEAPTLEGKVRAELRVAGYTDAELAQFTEELLYARNRAWIPKLEILFENNSALVAVGADHLRGDQGLPALLRARGYKVERVKPKN